MIEKHPSSDSQLPFASPNPSETSDERQRSQSQRFRHLFRNRARFVGSGMLILVTLLLAWDVIYGQNGLSAWSAKRTHDRMLTQQIERLRQENEALRHQNERLRDDPAAIEFQARQNLHYARPNEVIYAMPVASQPAPQSAAADRSPVPSH